MSAGRSDEALDIANAEQVDRTVQARLDMMMRIRLHHGDPGDAGTGRAVSSYGYNFAADDRQRNAA